jgi:hypothetical protein
MDYVTRQFINLVKHFRKDLRQALSDLNSALHKQTEAIRQSHQTENNKQSASPEVPPFANLPKSVEVHQNAKDAADERNYKRATFFVAALTFGALVIYAVLVYWQYREMINTTRATQNSAKAAERAAKVAQHTLELEQTPIIGIVETPTANNIDVTLMLKNFGKVPAILDAQAHVWLINSAIRWGNFSGYHICERSDWDFRQNQWRARLQPIYPGETKPFNFSVANLPQDAASDTNFDKAYPAPPSWNPSLLIGCIAIQGPFGHGLINLYHTRFLYLVNPAVPLPWTPQTIFRLQYLDTNVEEPTVLVPWK